MYISKNKYYKLCESLENEDNLITKQEDIALHLFIIRWKIWTFKKT